MLTFLMAYLGCPMSKRWNQRKRGAFKSNSLGTSRYQCRFKLLLAWYRYDDGQVLNEFSFLNWTKIETVQYDKYTFAHRFFGQCPKSH
jgi:hypothetical protein